MNENKLPLLDEKDLDELIRQAINGNGTLATPTEFSQLIINIPGISINSKPRKRDGRYQGYIVLKGEKRYVYGKTLDEVQAKIKQYLREGLPPKRKIKNIYTGVPTSFNAFSMYYFENFRKKIVSEKTYRTDLYRYNLYLKPYFGEKSLKRITPLDCQKLLEPIVEAGKGKTADEVHNLLSVTLKMAIKHNIITHNPLDIVLHISHERVHGEALSLDDVKRLKEALSGSKYSHSYLLTLYAGLRPNELKTAKIEGDFIVAVNSKRKNKKISYKKIPIAKELAPYLENGLQVHGSLNYLRKVVKEILPDHKLYDLRTTFNSRCIECGIADTARKYFMGHSLGTLGNAYTDLSDEFLIKEMQKLYYDEPF